MSNPVSRWVNNVFDAGSKLGDASRMRYETEAQKKEVEKKQAEARGQAWGALLQNRTYVDRKTGKAK